MLPEEWTAFPDLLILCAILCAHTREGERERGIRGQPRRQGCGNGLGVLGVNAQKARTECSCGVPEGVCTSKRVHRGLCTAI